MPIFTALRKRVARLFASIHPTTPLRQQAQPTPVPVPTGQIADLSPGDMREGWFVLGVLVSIGCVSFLIWTMLGFLLLALAALYAGQYIHEVRSPNRAFYFRQGICRGLARPGWYATLPELDQIVLLPMEWIPVNFDDLDVYSGDDPERKYAAEGVTFFRPLKQGDPGFEELEAELRKKTSVSVLSPQQIAGIAQEVLLRILQMTPKAMAAKVEAVALAALRRAFGARKTPELLKEKTKIEREAREKLQEEFAQNGYQVGDYEITRMQSDHIEITDRGAAQGKAFKAMADPLKGNYPGAIGVAVDSLAKPLGKALADLLKGAVKGQLPREGNESGSPLVTAAQAVRQAARR